MSDEAVFCYIVAANRYIYYHALYQIATYDSHRTMATVSHFTLIANLLVINMFIIVYENKFVRSALILDACSIFILPEFAVLILLIKNWYFDFIWACTVVREMWERAI